MDHIFRQTGYEPTFEGLKLEKSGAEAGINQRYEPTFEGLKRGPDSPRSTAWAFPTEISPKP
jgi:hypothetical protein